VLSCPTQSRRNRESGNWQIGSRPTFQSSEQHFTPRLGQSDRSTRGSCNRSFQMTFSTMYGWSEDRLANLRSTLGCERWESATHRLSRRWRVSHSKTSLCTPKSSPARSFFTNSFMPFSTNISNCRDSPSVTFAVFWPGDRTRKSLSRSKPMS